MIIYLLLQQINKMKKIKNFSLALFMLLLASVFVYAQPPEYADNDGLHEDNENLPEGFQSQEGLTYDQSTNTVTITGGYVKIPSSYYGNIKVKDGGIAQIPPGFKGSVESSNLGTIMMEDAIFTGDGSYSSEGGFTIKKGSILAKGNTVIISNAKNVKLEDGTIKGVADEECAVANQKFGEGTEFEYKPDGLEKGEIIIKGNPSTTTLPDAEIEERGGHYFFKGTDVEINFEESKIFLKKGDEITIANQKFHNEKFNTLLIFPKDDINDIKAVRIISVPKDATSIADIFSEAGYGWGSENREARARYYKQIFKKDYPLSGEENKNANIEFLKFLKDKEFVVHKGDLGEQIVIDSYAQQDTLTKNPKGVGISIPQEKKSENDPFVYIKGRKFDPRIPNLDKNGNILGYVNPEEITPETHLSETDIPDVLANMEKNPEMVKFVYETAKKEGIDPVEALAIFCVESHFDHFDKDGKSKNTAGNRGIGQITHWAVDQVNMNEGEKEDKEEKYFVDKHTAFDNPEDNIIVSIKYFKYNKERFGDNTVLAVSGYNLGPTDTSKLRHISYDSGRVNHITRYSAFRNYFKKNDPFSEIKKVS